MYNIYIIYRVHFRQINFQLSEKYNLIKANTFFVTFKIYFLGFVNQSEFKTFMYLFTSYLSILIGLVMYLY